MDLLNVEIEYRKSIGCEKLSLKEMAQRFATLGYRLDRSLDCRSMSRYLSNGRSYPCITTGVKEADTGRSAFHCESRRDENFEKMQQLRQDVFAVVRGCIFEA